MREHIDADTIVVGHSLGGVLVRAFAEAHPATASGLATIASPTPAFRPAWMREVGRWTEDGFAFTDLPAFLDLAFPGVPDEIRALTWSQPVITGDVVVGGGPGDEPRLAILAEDDAAVPAAEQLKAAADFRAPTAWAPGGHSPHVRHPELVATLLMNWLAPGAA